MKPVTRGLFALAFLAASCVPPESRHYQRAALTDAPAPGAAARVAANALLHIGIVDKARSAVLRPEAACTLTDQGTGAFHDLAAGRDYEVASDPEYGLAVGPYRVPGPVRIAAKEAGGFVRVDGRRYLGDLVARANRGGTVTVVDELDIEDYLRGVLPAEMSPDWPLEALKAQAVVARTFALANRGKFESAGFDLSGDVRSQVYAGGGPRAPQVERAVRETRGEVLGWKGTLLSAFYHSCCGGHTADYGSVWGAGNSPKPLRGVADRWCKASPQYSWSAYFADEDLLAALQRRGRHATRLKGIRVLRRDGAGFARTLRVSAREDDYDLKAADLRAWLGASDLKSVKIDRIARRRRGFEFIGRGFGHGVGLCQWGSRGMAGKGLGYRRILGHYFPGAALTRLD